MKELSATTEMRSYQVFGLSGLVLAFGLLGGWAGLASIQGAVIAPGTIVVESHSKRVQHRDGGIVAEIHVSEGDRVDAGDPLIRLDDTENRAQLAITESALHEVLAKRARLVAERDGDGVVRFPPELKARQAEPELADMLAGQERLFETHKASLDGKKEQLKQRIDQLHQEVTGLRAQAAATEQQRTLIAEEVSDLRTLLDQGLIPVSRVLALEREKARLEGTLGQLTADIARAEGRIGETRLQIIQLEDESRTRTLEELREAEARISELQQRRLEAQAALSRSLVLAPRSGLVHQLTIHTIGGVIAPGETFMLIVPEQDELVIEARVRPEDIDEVAENQAAMVRFTAFKQSNTMQAPAEVVHVSADLTQPDDTVPPYYAVRLRLPQVRFKQVADLKLKPGMPAEVFIQTRSRTPLSYLLQPLGDQIARSFRES